MDIEFGGMPDQQETDPNLVKLVLVVEIFFYLLNNKCFLILIGFFSYAILKVDYLNLYF